jgi:hypothetical protein
MPPLNIRLITSDQQHHDTLGVTNPRIRAPNLDRLAADGTRFDRAYCVTPTCFPSRATLITERYKMTVYRDADHGELFDLVSDPGEHRNRWDDPATRDVKAGLLLRFVQAEIQREPARMPRIAGA